MKKGGKRGMAANKAVCLLTAGMMIFSAGAMSGCGKKNSSGGSMSISQQEAMKKLAFKVTDIPVGDDVDLSGGNVTYKNGLIYGLYYKYEMKDDSYFGSIYITVIDDTGAKKSDFPVFEQKDVNTYGNVYGGLTVDDSGNITYMLCESSYDNTTGESNEKYRLVTVDGSGNKVSERDMGKVYTQEDMNNNKYFQGYVTDAQGNMYINLYSCIRVCDPDGNKLFDTESNNNDGNMWYGNLILTNAGVPAVFVSDYSTEKYTKTLREIDINAKGFGKDYDAGALNGQIYSGSGDYLCYSSSDTGIFGMRADNGSVEPVLSLLNLGVNSSNLSSFCINDDGSFITVAFDYSGYKTRTLISRIIPVDSSEVKEKKVMNLGCFYLDWNIRSRIAEFNKKNEEYNINVTSYSETNDTSDWQAALTKFNNELLAGNVPDILLLNSDMPVNSYINKGLFTDLYALMDKDPDLNRDAFMPNVLAALETNGKLYEITPSFSIITCAAKKSLVGDAKSITFEDANRILSGMPEGAQIFNYGMTSSDFLNTAIVYSDFVDYSSGTCSFDNPQFKLLLEYAKTLPQEIDYEKLYEENPNYWQENEKACRENKALLYNSYFYDFSSYTQYRDGNFGEDITLVGFPTSTPGVSGAGIYPGSEIAISSKSAYKEGAWQFIKDIIVNGVTEEPVYQWNEQTGESVDTGKKRWSSVNGSLPVLKDQLQKIGAQSTIPETYINAEGQEVEQDNSYYIGGEQDVKVKRITQAEVDMLIDYMSGITRVVRYDSSINDIIAEESKLFFDGAKSADETASIIQSRTSIYMSEQYK